MSSVPAQPDSESFVVRKWRSRDRPGWRNFGIAMLALTAALLLALFSAAVAETGRTVLAAIAAVLALALAGWVAVTIVPALARRTSFGWIVQKIDYRLTREGGIYLAAICVLIIAAMNTGNNLLFMVLGCTLAGLVISGVLSPAVLSGVSLKFDLPEHIFAEQPVLAEVELRNDKELWPSLSLRVVGESRRGPTQILNRPVFFPYIPRRGAARQKVELNFPRRGVYRQGAFGIRTRFPFGFFEKTRQIDANTEIIVYPHVEPTEQFYEVLPLLSGEIASVFRGRGHELYSLRKYLPTDSARYVDWKVSARQGQLMVREFAREDERRVMLVLDPFIGQSGGASARPDEATHAEKFERMVTLTACIAWHFSEINSVMQFCTNRFSTRMAPAREVIYEALKELATIQPNTSAKGGAFLDELASDREIFKIVLTARAQGTIPTALWSSSYFLFMNQL
ncbi:MAG TPA: DUF58 domain-containing protein [Candidatus Acidoferrales bacterium]|nr:DUF58 domain-containing protein [Candidatus Acidoferrales bacterium]